MRKRVPGAERRSPSPEPWFLLLPPFELSSRSVARWRHSPTKRIRDCFRLCQESPSADYNLLCHHHGVNTKGFLIIEKYFDVMESYICFLK